MHQSDGASIDRRPGIYECLSNHGVLPFQASVVEHSDESRKTVTASNDQRADSLTKVLPLEKLKHYNELLHVRA